MGNAAVAKIRGLYGMIDVPSPSPLALAEALLRGGVGVLQLRMKHGGAGEMLELAVELRRLCRRWDALFIVNDRLDVALAAEADGVHLGQDDLPFADARRLAPPGFVIGISTHDELQANVDADYIGFGPIFATTSKAQPDPIVGIERLRRVCAAAEIPVVAIGGITLDAVPSLVSAGAAAVAIISAVANAPDPEAAARQINAAFLAPER